MPDIGNQLAPGPRYGATNGHRTPAFVTNLFGCIRPEKVWLAASAKNQRQLRIAQASANKTKHRPHHESITKALTLHLHLFTLKVKASIYTTHNKQERNTTPHCYKSDQHKSSPPPIIRRAQQIPHNYDITRTSLNISPLRYDRSQQLYALKNKVEVQ